MSVFRNITSNICRCKCIIRCPCTIYKREYAALPKRFYKRTNVLYSDGLYEITLDQRKLKTPKGNIFKLENEALALAVAVEWDAQKENINRSSMHLTSLCNTVIDNPSNVNKLDLVSQILQALDTDTVLYHSEEDKELYAIQLQKWKPVIEWFNKEFDINIQATMNIATSVNESHIKDTVQRYLLSYNLPCLFAFSYAVDTLKSLILTLCCVHQQINIEQAVLLSRLEEEYQAKNWGKVEWAHDINQIDLQSRLSAAVLFIRLNTSFERQKFKHNTTNNILHDNKYSVTQ